MSYFPLTNKLHHLVGISMCAIRSAQWNCLLISSQQLHSSVRTGNLETCLRLLSLGAQANFFHPVSDKENVLFCVCLCKQLQVFLKIVLLFPGQQEKGNTPLHIAAKAGQMLQAELLAVYGADPGALDSSGKTPIDYARWRFIWNFF